MDCGRLEQGRRIDDVWSVGPALFDPADACAFNCLIRSMSASCQVQRPCCHLALYKGAEMFKSCYPVSTYFIH